MNKTMNLIEYIATHCDDIMKLALFKDRFALWKLACPQLRDVEFIRQGIVRCISPVNSGRHFLQMIDEVLDDKITLSTYFNALKSPRRTKMLKALDAQSYLINDKAMTDQGIDYLKGYPELDDYTIEAADGHFFDHACHTPKGANGKAYAAGSIYALNLRNGLLRLLTVITNGTVRNHEIPILRRYIEDENQGESSSKKHVYIYDKAVIDHSWWARQRSHNNFMISVHKENSVATKLAAIEYDKDNPINIGVESYDVYETKSATFSIVCYRDPETKILHKFITTMPISINPGLIALLYFKRWTIEKAYNNSKSDLKENKAWSPNVNSINNQARLITMTYNLIRVFEETSKTENPDKMHISDKKYIKSLDVRQRAAQKIGAFVNPLLFNPRITRICSNTIRAVQNAILNNRPLLKLFDSLERQLRPRTEPSTQH